MRIVLPAFFLLVFLWFGCGTAPVYQHLEGQAQGTTFSIKYQDSLGRDFSGQVDSIFRLIDKSMSVWDTTSIITGFNRNLPGTRADEHFTAVFERAQEIYALTGGMFDITVGPLVKTWGFSYKKNMPFPDTPQVKALLALVGSDKVRLDSAGGLVKDNPQIEIDFNAIAQGYTVDLLCRFLKEHGVYDYMVEVGGEVRAAGINESGETWRIGIDRPAPDSSARQRVLQAIVSLDDRALATSGSYRKFIERDGRKYSHAIHPGTGFPVEHSLLSVSVLAADCTTADAFATAFLVMGMENAMLLAREHGLDIYCIYSDENGALQEAFSPGFEKIMQRDISE